jgi:hypothetical protein
MQTPMAASDTAAADSAGEGASPRAETGGDRSPRQGAAKAARASAARDAKAARASAARDAKAARASAVRATKAARESATEAPPTPTASPAAASPLARQLADSEPLRRWIGQHPVLLRLMDRSADQQLDATEIDSVLATAADWAGRIRDHNTAWYYADEGKPVGPRNWWFIRELGKRRPDLLVAQEGASSWLPVEAVARVVDAVEAEGGGEPVARAS